MKILDLRSWDHCLVDRLWRYWDQQSEPLLRMLSTVTENCSRLVLKQRMANRSRPPAKPLIISVGNLRIGGTGKTPVVIEIAQSLAARGIDGTVLVRGYGSSCKGPLIVEAQDKRCGDEARMIVATLSDQKWKVIQARKRAEGLAVVLAAKSPPQVVIVEDGHQTAGVPRHLDVLILDRWQIANTGKNPVVQPSCGMVIPWGPYRESTPLIIRGPGLPLMLLVTNPVRVY